MVYINKAQRKTVLEKFRINPDGAKSYREFRKRLQPYIGGSCVMLPWCGMWVGIELNGEPHT